MNSINILSSDFYELVYIKMVDNPELSFIEAYRLVKDDVLMKQLNTGDGCIDGFNYVDLGLPSGTMWATCNIGSESIIEDGLLFQWGNIQGYYYGDEEHKFTTAQENELLTGSKHINKTTSGLIYNCNNKLNETDDIAHEYMKGKWWMPDKYDLDELFLYTYKRIITIHNKRGIIFTSVINNKSLFIPFSGLYDYSENKFKNNNESGFLWSSQVCSDYISGAYRVYGLKDDNINIDDNNRTFGYSVHGVIKTNY